MFCTLHNSIIFIALSLHYDVDVNKDDCRDYPPGPGCVRLRAGERRARGEAHHLPRSRARRRGAALPAAAARQLRGPRARHTGAACAGLPRVYSLVSIVTLHLNCHGDD